VRTGENGCILYCLKRVLGVIRYCIGWLLGVIQKFLFECEELRAGNAEGKSRFALNKNQ
jgi:hypothetical protein